MEKPGDVASAGTGGGSPPPPPRLDCIKCFDALWFCYSPFHQMQSYYRCGEFDNCFGKWGDLIDCFSLKTKRRAEVEEILLARERDRPHIWTYRSVDEASEHWWQMYKNVITPPPQQQPSGAATSAVPPPPESGIS
ncbi:hypothetical protein GUJ93_ZPchr0013g35501 [Zizania palustris]|uniref:Uncharacterized protein n=1 Tax=Zizania palustris TaxID=103762 RepID=A0A8J5WZZ3_ZIZPA|nr:hypothetical protein GUJ93_ZPchr0013g35501 [Zizania palustris]